MLTPVRSRFETSRFGTSWGYGAPAAAELAMRHDVDLHVAVEMLTQGCAPALALKILL